MHIEFSAVKARNAVERWTSQYRDYRHDASKNDITEKLHALPPEGRTATAIAQIIGNKSWSYPSCTECHEYVDIAISFGEDGNGSTLCLSCLRSAQAALQAAATAMAQIGAPK